MICPYMDHFTKCVYDESDDPYFDISCDDCEYSHESYQETESDVDEQSCDSSREIDMRCQVDGYYHNCTGVLCEECDVFLAWKREFCLLKIFTWHVLAEEKPKVDGDYIVKLESEKFSRYAFWKNEDTRFVDYDGTVFFGTVSYWAPMPEPPFEPLKEVR